MATLLLSLKAWLWPSSVWPHYKRHYEFTEDWFTSRLMIWRKFLQPWRGRPGLRVLEVGCFEGRSTVWLLENIATNPSSRLLCVDTFDPKNPRLEQRFRHNLAKTGAENRVEVRVAPSREILPQLPVSGFDLIYIDGAHTYDDVREDAQNAWPLLRSRGLIIFDDFDWPEVSKALSEFLFSHSGQCQMLHASKQLLLEKMS